MLLNFRQYSHEGESLLILHGLFGSLGNWGAHSKFLAEHYSVIGVDHPAYQDNVFLMWPKHCQTTCDVDLEPTAVLFLRDYPEEVAPVPSEEIPVFHTFVYPQERARFLSIPIVANSFCPPSSPPKGQTLSQLIDSLGGVEILGLDRGQAV